MKKIKNALDYEALTEKTLFIKMGSMESYLSSKFLKLYQDYIDLVKN